MNASDRVKSLRVGLAKVLRGALARVEQERPTEKSSVENQIQMSWDEFDNKMQAALVENYNTITRDKPEVANHSSEAPQTTYLRFTVGSSDTMSIVLGLGEEIIYSIELDRFIETDRIDAFNIAETFLNLEEDTMSIEVGEGEEIKYLAQIGRRDAVDCGEKILNWLES